MRRTLALLVAASMPLAAPAAQARPGDLDRGFSGDGRLAFGTSGVVAGLALAGDLRPVLTVNPTQDRGRPAWIDLTATGRVADRIAMPAPMMSARAVWSGAALDFLKAGEAALVRHGNAPAMTLTLPDATNSPSTLAIDGAGRVLVGGSSLNQPSRSAVMRFLPTGALDTTYAVAQPPSIGRIAFILPGIDGSAYVSDGERIALLDPTGQPQAGFEQGRRFTPRRDRDSRARSLDRGPDGTLLAAGDGDPTGPWIARLRADGRLDPHFGRTGHVSGGSALRRVSLTAVTHDRRGRLLAVGYRRRDGERYDAVVLRFSANGRLDRSFGKGGRTLFKLGIVPGVDFDDSSPRYVAVDRRGRIVVAGTVYDGDVPPTPYPAVARLSG
jgi:uncharacterized delta-60 repeat protein